MEFHHMPPGTGGKGEVARTSSARPYPVQSPRRAATSYSTAPTCRPVRQAASIALYWFGWFIPLSLVTQLWAGSHFSPGHGGGLKELVGWVVAFGAITAGLVAKRAADDPTVEWAAPAARGATWGFLAGVVTALVWFTSKGGPATGDWFVGPAMACVGVAIALAIRRARR